MCGEMYCIYAAKGMNIVAIHVCDICKAIGEFYSAVDN